MEFDGVVWRLFLWMLVSVVLTYLAWGALIFLQRNHWELLPTVALGNRQVADILFAFVLPIVLNLVLAWLLGLFSIARPRLERAVVIVIAVLLPLADFALAWRIACFSSC